MSQINTNAILDASGGTTATVNGFTPTVSNMAGRNRIINGDMRIDQRNAGAAVSNNASRTYTLDRWAYVASQSSKFTVQQTPSATETGYATRVAAGFTNYLAVTSSSAYSVGSSDYFVIQQRIEGYNAADLAWGTSSAKIITLSFWVYSSLTGTFGGALQNNSADRSYPFTYTVSAANTWEQKTVTIAGDTSGTWLTTNGLGIVLQIGLGVGSTYAGTAGTWAGANYLGATGATSVVGTSGATFYITGVQLEAGSVATPFEHRQYGQELALCQRYLPVVSAGNGDVSGSGYCATTNTNFNIALPFKVPARTAPTGLTASSAGHFYIQASSGGGTVTNVTFGAGGVNGAYVTFAAPAGTSGQGCFIQTISNSANLYFNGCEL